MKVIKNAEVKLENGYINIKIPSSLLNDLVTIKDWSILTKVKGMWKNKKLDALEYQIRIRKEWK